MKADSVRTILRSLSEANVRFLVAGGLAVNAHGVVHLTNDVDLVIQLVPDNIQNAFRALAAIGYRPAVPVTAQDFADESKRADWIATKGMQVMNFWSHKHRETPLDVFVAEPFPFDEEYGRALVRTVEGRAAARISSPFG